MTTMSNEDPADPSAHEPRVTDAPDEIWLVYGKLEHDEAHADINRDGDVLWCEHQIEASDVRYVRADKMTAVTDAALPLPNPVACAQPDHLQKARLAQFLCRVEPTQRCADFVPLYTADQVRAAIAAESARSAVATEHIAAGLRAAEEERDELRAKVERQREERDALAAIRLINLDERASA